MKRGKLGTLALTNDTRMKAIIRALWREYYGLYNEKYLTPLFDKDNNLITVDDEGITIDNWLRNTISKEIKHGQAIGQDHLISGNRSTAIGQGGQTTSFMELLLGAYPILAEEQDPEKWIPADRLVALGNGTDDENRSLVFEILKNGIVQFFNSVKIGKWDPKTEGETPDEGTLQWTPEDGLQEWQTDHWENIPVPKATEADVINATDETVINRYLAPDHLHLLEAYCVGGRGDNATSHQIELWGSDPAVAGVTIYADQQIAWNY